jgi:uncharacterized protein (DUF2235 family)
MSKRLIVCADGTWNKRDRTEDHRNTNVAKLCDAIVQIDTHGVRQYVKYQKGVGTGPWYDKILGGVTGAGLSQNIRECYTWIVDNYEPGDELFLFGFSRGAFTARSLVGFIRNCGILRPEHRGHVSKAYEFYRDRDPGKHPRTQVAQIFRDTYARPDKPIIKCLGVWDTVGSLGIPTTGPIGTLSRRLFGFHDMKLSSWVQNAFHAVAIDELRKPFRPTLWELTDQDRAESIALGQRIEQVWFAGVHSNVGGGYPNAELSDLALRWMLDRASACGLGLAPEAAEYVGDCCGELRSSMTWYYRPFGTHERSVLAPRAGVHAFEAVSPSAFDRRRTFRPPKFSPPYEPRNLAHIQQPQPRGAATPIR